MQDKKEKIVTDNRKARHDYFIDQVFEAGLALTGTEVKSLRTGKANLQDSFCTIREGEIFLHNCHISPYEQGNIFNVEPKRTRKILMHKEEIRKLAQKVREKGFTLVPLRLYFNDKGKVKLALALARGKKTYDKRDDLAEKDAKRDLARAIRGKE
ncbi:MAG: SsrA-binding protein SmpB [Clostridia bacterium]